MGLPWLIATISEEARGNVCGYFVPAESLGFSVVVFCIVAITCIIFLMIKRKVTGGELGGSPAARYGGCIFLVSLWLLYIILSVL